MHAWVSAPTRMSVYVHVCVDDCLYECMGECAPMCTRVRTCARAHSCEDHRAGNCGSLPPLGSRIEYVLFLFQEYL